jgi:hypothetical protein
MESIPNIRYQQGNNILSPLSGASDLYHLQHTLPAQRFRIMSTLPGYTGITALYTCSENKRDSEPSSLNTKYEKQDSHHIAPVQRFKIISTLSKD